MFDLKGLREKLYGGLTQKEFGKLFEMSQDRVSRIENGNATIDVDELGRISTITGISMNQLMNLEKEILKPLDIKNTWCVTEDSKDRILHYLDDGLNNTGPWGKYFSQELGQLSGTVDKIFRKPRIAIIGHSDVGKSHMINSIIGGSLLPVDWTPVTSVINYIMHVSDRPDFMSEDVWLFKKLKTDDGSWDSLKLKDEIYCKERLVSSGGYGILNDYGTRDGEYAYDSDVVSAVTFVDSDFCKNAVLMDVPGYGTGDRDADDEMTIEAKANADILIFLSLSNAFLRGDEIDYLKESINALSIIESSKSNAIEPLGNLFVVASQAHVIGKWNPMAAEVVLDKGCQRALQTLPDGYWEERSKVTGCSYDYETIRKRFFTYTTDVESLRMAFINDLITLVEELPKVILSQGMNLLRQRIGKEVQVADQHILENIKLMENREDAKKQLDDLLANEPTRLDKHRKLKKSVMEKIHGHRKNSIEAIGEAYNTVISEAYIISTIEKKDLKRVKEDSGLLSSYLNSEIQARLQKILESESLILKETIDDYLEQFENTTYKNIDIVDNNILDIGFDSKAIFAGGLTGLATFGGLSIWAASMGNLGAYILVAKGVSVLSGIGISVAGGTAGAVAAVSSIGGPVTLGIGIALMAAFAVFAAVAGGWKKKTAQKLIKSYETQNVLFKYKTVIDNYWKETKNAFEVSSTTLDEKWISRITDLESMLANDDAKVIEEVCDYGKSYKAFLQAMPYGE